MKNGCLQHLQNVFLFSFFAALWVTSAFILVSDSWISVSSPGRQSFCDSVASMSLTTSSSRIEKKMRKEKIIIVHYLMD